MKEGSAASEAGDELFKKGDVIGGKYEVHGQIGKGGFGLVLLVYDREDGDVCALKTFRDEFLADAAARGAFRREALLWVNLDEHPFILAAQYIEEFSGRLFVGMNYIAPDERGWVSLADHLVRFRNGQDADQALKWAIQFCRGMEHANAHGIEAHRDIKPTNILISQDGTLKISDFGLAAAAAHASPTGPSGSIVTGGSDGVGLSVVLSGGRRVSGTPGYIAPEVFRGEKADVRSDIYSFGLVLWQMAAGSRKPPSSIRASQTL